jgi:predicted Zn finger-like uncharacterized protein
MDDQVTETHVTGFAQNIMASIKGVVIGLILFLASFVVLWCNEGRIDLSKVAQTSIPVQAESVDHSTDGKFVSVTGRLESNESTGDPWHLRSGPYIALYRNVEMYSWVEDRSTKTTKKTGGQKVTETTYSYNKEWTDDPPDSSGFHKPEGHHNPSPGEKSQTFTTKRAFIGAYSFNPSSARLPKPAPVQIGKDEFIPSLNAHLNGAYIFIGGETLQNPEIGDLRISYSAVRIGVIATLFGTQNGDSITPHLYNGNKQLYRAIAGSRENAIATMATEHRISTWILRLVGFVMMWIGLCLFFGPINTVLDFLPALGGVGRLVVGLSMFVAAIALTLITVIVSVIAHNVFLLVAVIACFLIAPWVIRRVRPGKAPSKSGSKKGDTLPLRDSHPATVKAGDAAMQQAMQKIDAAESTITFVCKECGARYTVQKSLGGRKARCKYCEHKFYIPTDSSDQNKKKEETPDSSGSERTGINSP